MILSTDSMWVTNPLILAAASGYCVHVALAPNRRARFLLSCRHRPVSGPNSYTGIGSTCTGPAVSSAAGVRTVGGEIVRIVPYEKGLKSLLDTSRRSWSALCGRDVLNR